MKNNTFLIWYQTEDSSQFQAGGALLKERRDTRYRCGTEEEHLDNITQEFENSVQFIAKDYLSQKSIRSKLQENNVFFSIYSLISNCIYCMYR
jgi:hypothetical protein